MQLLEYYQRLFRYEVWANQEVLAGLKTSANDLSRARKFVAHILAAEFIWLERILGEPNSSPVWPELTLAQCEEYLARIGQKWQAYLAALTEADLHKAIAYTNTKGETFRTPVSDILTHVLLHAAYHRGQIATDMRAAGSTPVYTDFIHAARAGLIDSVNAPMNA